MTSALQKPLFNAHRKFARRLHSHYLNSIFNRLYHANSMNSNAKPPTRKKRSERLGDSDSYGQDSSGCWLVMIAGLVWLVVIIFSNINTK